MFWGENEVPRVQKSGLCLVNLIFDGKFAGCYKGLVDIFIYFDRFIYIYFIQGSLQIFRSCPFFTIKSKIVNT